MSGIAQYVIKPTASIKKRKSDASMKKKGAKDEDKKSIISI
jgi:hypothetical protein